MSVDVNTLSPAQFEHAEFPCGEKTILGKDNGVSAVQSAETKSNVVELDTSKLRNDSTQVLASQDTYQKAVQLKKRRSMESYKLQGQPPMKRRNSFRGGKGKIVLPTKFLLGGNINDPLNLNSLCDEEINKALNAQTPSSSPLPTPMHRKQVHVLIPPNINDPLNLNSGEDIDIISPKLPNKKKKKHHHKKRKSAGEVAGPNDASADPGDVEKSEAQKPDTLKIIIPDAAEISKSMGNKVQNVIDQIVSPVIPQRSPKWRRKRGASECKSEPETAVKSSKVVTPTEESAPQPSKPAAAGAPKAEKASPQKCKNKRQPPSHPPQGGPKFRSKNQPFIYGNYNRYYGKRNPQEEEDCRLKCFHKDWFDGKDVLDIGCNIGHITLSVAKELQPRKIVGMDIDGKLISVARKNVRHYMSKDQYKGKHFPISLSITHGPMAAPPSGDSQALFPNNVSFLQSNYVLESDELVDLQREEYDCIMALSITKWVHLNNGDAGIKRFFKRVFRQLRPGGRFILEPQSWASYKKKKKLTETIFKHYQQIRFRPEHFTAHLLSPDVGFSVCDLIDMPFNKSKGFQRPIQVYTKPDTSYTTPREITESRGVTPLMEINCTPHFDVPSYALLELQASRNNTPHYDVRYTPGSYDRTTPSYAMWSSNATPRIDEPSESTLVQGGESRETTPPGETSSQPTPSESQAGKDSGPKYTFVSGDPRGGTPSYACDSRGATPVHASSSRSSTPVKYIGSNVHEASKSQAALEKLEENESETKSVPSRSVNAKHQMKDEELEAEKTKSESSPGGNDDKSNRKDIGEEDTECAIQEHADNSDSENKNAECEMDSQEKEEAIAEVSQSSATHESVSNSSEMQTEGSSQDLSQTSSSLSDQSATQTSSGSGESSQSVQSSQ